MKRFCVKYSFKNRGPPLFDSKQHNVPVQERSIITAHSIPVRNNKKKKTKKQNDK